MKINSIIGVDFFKAHLLNSSKKLAMFWGKPLIYVSVVNDLDNGNWLLLPQEAVTGLGKGEVGDHIF